jgi:hypothetical protein
MGSWRIILPFALLFALAGCSQMGTIDPTYRLGDHPDEGVAIVSVSATGLEDMASATWNYRPLPTGGTAKAPDLFNTHSLGAVRIFGGIVPSKAVELDFQQPVGRVVAFRAPPGLYEFYQWGASLNNFHLTPQTQVSLKFEILPGQAVYLGSLNILVLPTGTDLERPRRAQVFVTDKRTRDLPIARTKWPNIPEERVTVHIMDWPAPRLDIPKPAVDHTN